MARPLLQLGALVGQLAMVHEGSGEAFIDKLAVEVIGEPSERGATACANATLVGLLRPFLAAPVNEINAPIIAADRGIELSESAGSATAISPRPSR